jgi:hypothetical protein
VDPGGSEWRLIASLFGDDEILCSDIEGFESGVSNLCYKFMRDLIYEAYDDPWERRFACYVICSTINAVRFDFGLGFCLGRQNTSGNWLTTWINTVVNKLYFSIVVIHGATIANEDVEKALRQLKDKIYSDDNLVALFRNWFTPEFVVDTFRDLLHVNVTAVDKGNNVKMMKIWDASFLSRGFRKYRGQVFCPLAYESLISQIYFVRIPKKRMGDTNFMYKQLQQNLDNVARELREYEPSEAINLANEIILFLRKWKLPLRFPFDFVTDPVVTKLLLQ